MATPSHFHEHGPRDTRSRVLTAFSLTVDGIHSIT
jgi:hypothetical protein